MRADSGWADQLLAARICGRIVQWDPSSASYRLTTEQQHLEDEPSDTVASRHRTDWVKWSADPARMQAFGRHGTAAAVGLLGETERLGGTAVQLRVGEMTLAPEVLGGLWFYEWLPAPQSVEVIRPGDVSTVSFERQSHYLQS